MCMFPLPNYNITGQAYRSGIHEFKCGSCPECLKEKASKWALRGYAEASLHADNCMVTLTYDNYARDKNGYIVGELPPDNTLSVSRRDVQLFIKRLRKWWSKTHKDPIKVLYCAEYGSRTHRAHYHCILFGVKFPDLVPYKKSNRGNLIQKSAILTKLWNHGICTVDSVNVSAACVSYCTKYLAKNRTEDTFMGFSHGIGDAYLLEKFNGVSYIVEGREMPVPSRIWNKVIQDRYSGLVPNLSFKYLNRTDDNYLSGEWQENVLQRKVFSAVKRSDKQYQKYLQYWSKIAENLKLKQQPVSNRIMLLPDAKFIRYKSAALKALGEYNRTGIMYIPPFSNRVSAHYRDMVDREKRLGIKYITQYRRKMRFPSCHESANDTDFYEKHKLKRIYDPDPFERQFFIPIPADDYVQYAQFPTI